ncbi:MAG: 30S ribosomal protein S12 methylthiotransferase RimO [Negativicutes bacterium]|nr:30S ribosomal protein S12 methylthiotransferase RimO [Negativicutes bacterium]
MTEKPAARLGNFAVIQLGCAKNTVDGEYITGLLQSAGGRPVRDLRRAEIIVVNTCAFVETAREESVVAILRAAGYKRHRCRQLLVCGCLSARHGQELLAEIDEVDAVIGIRAWPAILEIIARVGRGERLWCVEDRISSMPVLPARRLSTPAYTAWLRIADGCNNRCHYCSIPLIRGGLSSRPPAAVLSEARRLVAGGVRELNLIAQDTTAYGSDWDGDQHLLPLLRQLTAIEGLVWLRLLYCHPARVGRDLLEFMAENSKMCRYLDIPIQHISDRILISMGRPEGQTDIVRLLRQIRQLMPDAALRTSLIVGYPGETDEDFTELERFVAETGFDHAGVFVYSPEPGTIAGSLPGQVAEEVKNERYHRLMARQADVSERRNRQLEGTRLTVLVEGEHRQLLNGVYGRSFRQAPDVDGKIFVEHAGGAGPGDFISCRISQGFAYDLIGERDD